MLTRDDITAIRRSEDCFVRSRSQENEHILVVALRDYSQERVYTPTEQRLFPESNGYSFIDGKNGRYREIRVENATAYDYGDHRYIVDYYNAYASLYDADEVRTVANALKVNDELQFIWRRSNNNATLNNVKLYRDDFHLASFRDGTLINKWLLSVSVTADSTARMIRID